MRYTTVLVFVTASLADVLVQVSPHPIDERSAQLSNKEITNRFDDRRLCESCRLKVERT